MSCVHLHGRGSCACRHVHVYRRNRAIQRGFDELTPEALLDRRLHCHGVATAVQAFRQRLYETFGVVHILFTILVLVGSFVHSVNRFGTKRGHEMWLCIATGIWAFDRIARFGRYMSRGVKTAYITTIDEDYYRVVTGSPYSWSYLRAFPGHQQMEALGKSSFLRRQQHQVAGRRPCTGGDDGTSKRL